MPRYLTVARRLALLAPLIAVPSAIAQQLSPQRLPPPPPLAPGCPARRPREGAPCRAGSQLPADCNYGWVHCHCVEPNGRPANRWVCNAHGANRGPLPPPDLSA